MRTTLVALLIVGAMLGASGASRAAGRGRPPTIAITDFTLANGLRVLFAPMRQVPGVTVQVWYRVGSKDEGRTVRGIAHLFEHMMFKGSSRVPPEEHARMIAAVGGDDNAFTTQDFTVYHDTLPRRYLDFALELEAERMRNLKLTQHTIKSEREVVKEEKRLRLENSPIGRALEAIHALAYARHPYAWTPAGDIPDLNRVTVPMCRSFYDTYYVPGNAVLIVVGDSTEAEVRAAVEKRFGAIPRGKEPPRVQVREPPQRELRERKADWASQLRVVLGAYHVPPAASPDLPALRVASALLSAGASSRLHQALVRKEKLAVAAGGFVQSQEHPGLMLVYAVGLPSHDLARMRERLLVHVERLATEPARARELGKVKNQLATAALNRLRTMDGLARELGQSVLLHGDPRAFLGEATKIDAVTAADVQRVARSYLARANLSLILLDVGGARGGKR
jgi:zinc protease